MSGYLTTKRIFSVCVSIAIAIVLFIVVRAFFPRITTNHLARPVAEWKTALKPLGFTGTVSNKGEFNFTDRNLLAIELKNVRIINADSIPKDCEFFIYRDGTIKFAAYSQTVSRWDDYGLEEGYFVEKKVNNDTMFVYRRNHQLKNVFELFDGIVNEWTPRQLPHHDN